MTESIQKKLLRVQPPRVKLTYEVEQRGELEKHELPFLVGIFADLSGDRVGDTRLPPYAQRQVQTIDQASFDSVLASCSPTVMLGQIKRTLPKNKPEDPDYLTGFITFTSLADFSPQAVIQAIPDLRALYAARSELQKNDPTNNQLIAFDQLLNEQLREVFHASSFKQLEATWRGLSYLVAHTDTSNLLQLVVLNATKTELYQDLEKAIELDQSHFYKIIYEACYGTYGGAPYGLLVGDYEFGRSAQDIAMLTQIANVAAAAHAPFITAASADLFGLSAFTQLNKPRTLNKIFESADLAGWQEFRQTDNSRYVALALPHVLLRLPYGVQSQGVQSQATDGWVFEEIIDPNQQEDCLWGNAAYFLAERITNAFALYSWTAAIRGVEGGGKVDGLPCYAYASDPTLPTKNTTIGPTEVAISDHREKELSQLGFIALCAQQGSESAVFFGGKTTNQPKKYFSDDANQNAAWSSTLPYVLVASRFMHYFNVIVRNKVGSFLTRANVETYLNTWVAQYVLLDEHATQDVKAAYPLSMATVTVTDIPGSPGQYSITAFLRPHFQLESLTTSLRISDQLYPV